MVQHLPAYEVQSFLNGASHMKTDSHATWWHPWSTEGCFSSWQHMKISKGWTTTLHIGWWCQGLTIQGPYIWVGWRRQSQRGTVTPAAAWGVVSGLNALLGELLGRKPQHGKYFWQPLRLALKQPPNRCHLTAFINKYNNFNVSYQWLY
jgi:hypothetical protein